MTPNQRLMLDRLEYPAPGLTQSVAEVFAPIIVFVGMGLLTLNVLQGNAQDHAKASCAEIAAYYGIGTSHAMLPPGVKIEYHANRCVRTDNLTVMTGNER